MKRPSLSPLRLFDPATAFPQLAGATAGASAGRSGGGAMLFARNSGGGSGSGGRRPDDVDPEFDDFDDATYAYEDEAPASSRGRRGATNATTAAGGSGGSAGGRQRTVQFQPEERYWTEYLRIALPVIGLLLMLGLFWFWAQQLIGDNDKEPEATSVPGVVVTPTEQINVPTATVEVVVTEPPAPTVAPTEPPAEPTATTATENPATPPAAEIVVGGTVTTTEEVNLRPEASTTGDAVAVLPAGTTLTVIGGPQEADGYTWWNVEDTEGDTGWVVADFIQASGV
ncbi:MAG: SH3 domain-containing protein [Thermomicrobiales bacterium]